MKKFTVTVVLVMLVFLAADTEANWLKKALKEAGKFTKETIRSKAVAGVVEVVRRFGPRLLGKRSVDLPLVGTISDQRAREMINALDLACLKFSGASGGRAVTAEDVQAAFGASDGNRDKGLNGQEISLFENTIDAIQHCFEFLKSKGK